MENKYLNLTGAVYIISKIKTLLEDKSDKGHTHSKEEIGLGNVENKSSQTIRGGLIVIQDSIPAILDKCKS